MREPQVSYDQKRVEGLLTTMFLGSPPPAEGRPEEGMPKAASNPAHRGTEMAEAVDIERAWWKALPYMFSPSLFWLRYRDDLDFDTIAEKVGSMSASVAYSLEHDLNLIMLAINGKDIPKGEL